MNPSQLPCIQLDLDSSAATERRRLQNRMSQRKFRQKKAQEQKLSKTMFVLSTEETPPEPASGSAPGLAAHYPPSPWPLPNLHNFPATSGVSDEIVFDTTLWQPQQQPSYFPPHASGSGSGNGIENNNSNERESGQPSIDANASSNDMSSAMLSPPLPYYPQSTDHISTAGSWNSSPEETVENRIALQWPPESAGSRRSSLVANSSSTAHSIPSASVQSKIPSSRSRRKSRPSSSSPKSAPVPPPSLTPLLHISARKGNRGVLQTLLKHGSAIDEQDSHGRTALHVAAEHGHKAVVSLLLKSGADSEALDLDGKSPLYLAVSAGQNEVVDLLLSYQAR